MWVNSADSSTKYWVHPVKGHINGLEEKVRVIISKRHPGDKRPEYFMCTDPDYPMRKVLSRYTWRWAIEVDHWYLKTRLGLEHFRVRSLEGISKYFTLCFVSLAYLSWRMGTQRRRSVDKIAEVIDRHRSENTKAFLRTFGETILQGKSIENAIAQFLPD